MGIIYIAMFLINIYNLGDKHGIVYEMREIFECWKKVNMEMRFGL